MRKVKYAVCFMISALIAAFLHYTLPQHDIVRITGSYNRVTTVGSNKIFYANSDAGTAESTTTRDIRFIEAVRDNGNVIVYRNEDTGWIWPPYFKWNSSNVQAEASNLKSDKDAPIWVSITHYGWRMSWISIYPNAVSISAAAGPDVNITPWFNTIFFVFLAGLAIYIWRAWVRFRDNTLESALDELHGEIYRVGASGQATRQLLYLRWLAFKSTVRNALKRT